MEKRKIKMTARMKTARRYLNDSRYWVESFSTISVVELVTIPVVAAVVSVVCCAVTIVSIKRQSVKNLILLKISKYIILLILIYRFTHLPIFTDF